MHQRDIETPANLHVQYFIFKFRIFFPFPLLGVNYASFVFFINVWWSRPLSLCMHRYPLIRASPYLCLNTVFFSSGTNLYTN
jgi:hypothetical protein